MSSRHRMLVFGASGLVGSHVFAEASRRGWRVTGAARHVDGQATEPVDLTERDSVERLISRCEPSVVVIASAFAWVDGCEKDPGRSHRENVETVEQLCDALGRANTRLVFYSTDHVFNGKKHVYVEDDTPHPLNVYAKHKLEAEGLLLRHGHALIARTSYVFGREHRRKSFLYRVIDAAKSGQPLRVPAAQAGMPTWAGWLASATLELVEQKVDGVVHLVGPEVLTKAEWARRLAAGLGLPAVEVIETTAAEAGQLAPRPDRVHLATLRHQLRHPPLDSLLEAERAALLTPEH